MNKKEVVSEIQNKIASKYALSANAVNMVIDAYQEVIVDAARKGDQVKFPGFGTYSVSVRKQRNGINPFTGQPMTVDESKVLKFKASNKVKESL